MVGCLSAALSGRSQIKVSLNEARAKNATCRFDAIPEETLVVGLGYHHILALRNGREL
jgi:hypothetical protein